MTPVIDWVSPVRPQGTDIAEYTSRVHDALAGRYVLNVVENDRARDLSAFRFEFGPIFNLGNDARFHGATLEACRATSGIVVAHDYRIQDLIVSHIKASHGDWRKTYLDLMARHYGKDGHAAARDFVNGNCSLSELADIYPGIEIAADNALCVVTHNPGLAEKLAYRTGLYCATLPLPFPVKVPSPSVAPAPASGKINLLVFGYLGQNRGLDAAFELVRQRQDLRLHIAGQIGTEPLLNEARQLLRSGYPIIDHGFLPEDALNELIGQCDLVLNLRHPTMGEVSGSQLRIFANQGLSVVCNTGWYASLPENTVLKIDPKRMLPELHAILDQFSHDRDSLTMRRKEGHQYVREHHSLDRFAICFERFMNASQEALMHGRSVLLAKHIGGLYELSGAGKAARGEMLFNKARHLLGID
jgi:glycosyltransferase involved in cell wall biosynthesis